MRNSPLPPIVEGIWLFCLVESKEVPEWIENARRQLQAQLKKLKQLSYEIWN